MSYLIINNNKVAFAHGETILQAAAKAGINIPNLCWLPQSGHCNVCRICSVEVKGQDNFLAACATFAEENMEIQTHTEELFALRREILAMVVAEGRHECFLRHKPKGSWPAYQLAAMDMPHREFPCPKEGECSLQKLVLEYDVPVANLVPVDGDFPLDNAYPMITRDFSRCIRCGRCAAVCDAIQVNEAIAHQFGNSKEDWWPWVDYDKCTHCGECLQYCPTGALLAKKAYGLEENKENITKIRTTCPYCGVGCQQELMVKDGRIIKVNGVEGAEPNQGSLCVKGRFGYDFIYSKERLTQPLIRREDGTLKPASWDEALELVAKKFAQTVEQHGPQSVGGVSCSRSINEDSYQMQKLFRSIFKTNNIDNCART